MLIKLDEIDHFFGYQDIFFDVNLSVYNEDKIALIGKNGSGKTTLLKILSEEIEPMEGKITKNNSLKIGFLKQFRIENKNENLYNFVKSEIKNEVDEMMVDKTVKGILLGLGFEENEWERPVGTLSGGELTRLSLGKTLAGNHNLLLLDEPTNHLDLYSINWLQNYLKNYKGAVIIVSHDRNFLNEVCNKYWELNNYKLWNFSGNFSTYMEQRELFINSIESRKKNLLKEIDRVQAMVKRFRKWATEKMIRQAIIRERTLEKLKKEYSQIDNLIMEQSIKIKIPEPERTGLNVVKVENLSFSYSEDKKLLKKVSFVLEENKKIAIIGKNGCGKSTLLNILTGKIKDFKGNFEWGHNIKVGYIDQVISTFTKDKDIVNEMWAMMPEKPDYEVRKYIGRFGFTGEDVFKKIEELSGGELTRLALAKLIFKKPNVLILDEPTNHLDILTVQVLEDTLKEFKGAIILVSHDVKLLRNICDKYIFINNGYSEISADLDKFLSIITQDSFKLQKSKKRKHTYEQEKKLKNRILALERNLENARKLAEEYFLKLDKIEKDMIKYGDNYPKLEKLINEKKSIEESILNEEEREHEILKELEEIK